MRPSTSSFVVIRPRICAELCIRDAVAFSQYEQGGYLGSPDLSPAVLSTRDHRGADLALPRHAVNSPVPLGKQDRTGVLVLSRDISASQGVYGATPLRRRAGHGGTRVTDEMQATGHPRYERRKASHGGRGYGFNSAPSRLPVSAPQLLACSPSLVP